MKKWFKVLLLAVVLSVGLTGCVESTDPASGETQYALDAEKAAEVEKYVETGITVLMALSVIWPGLIPAGLAAILIGALAAFRKIKPQLVDAKSEAEQYHSTTASVVAAIEAFKESNPDDWTKLEEKLKKALGPAAENIIRALRGLPPIT